MTVPIASGLRLPSLSLTEPVLRSQFPSVDFSLAAETCSFVSPELASALAPSIGSELPSLPTAEVGPTTILSVPPCPSPRESL
eukprot:scaffold48_cov311-Pinguiococcus_pyrenoidosus.AAC.136